MGKEGDLPVGRKPLSQCPFRPQCSQRLGETSGAWFKASQQIFLHIMQSDRDFSDIQLYNCARYVCILPISTF